MMGHEAMNNLYRHVGEWERGSIVLLVMLIVSTLQRSRIRSEALWTKKQIRLGNYVFLYFNNSVHEDKCHAAKHLQGWMIKNGEYKKVHLRRWRKLNSSASCQVFFSGKVRVGIGGNSILVPKVL